MPKIALITGITGQDGSYLVEFLLEKGYEVHGIHRRSSLPNTGRIEHLLNKITLHYGDLTDSTSLIRIINQVKPDEIYNLAAQSNVQTSYDVPEYSGISTIQFGGMNRMNSLRHWLGKNINIWLQ